ncbi:hypothetical protein TA3x_002152 [Tundrisphaera sp. TA3]|uniref:hypothetical protein n=1 Tax=Tundrisphaera sp. TA3 TaxID=3435775 RepID=UPI003EB77C0D
MPYMMTKSRTNIPPMIARELRREVGFGCPFNGCRIPFLEYHHFDPTWSEAQSHIQQGMIALCPKHHRMADQGQISKKQLKLLKCHPTSALAVQDKFGWIRPDQLIRIGGVYCNPNRYALLLNPGVDREIIQFDVGNEEMLETSFTLRNHQGTLIASMSANSFLAYPQNLTDLHVTASGSMVKIKTKGVIRNEDTVLDAALKHLNLDELKKLIDDDWDNFRDTIKNKRRGDVDKIEYSRVNLYAGPPTLDLTVQERPDDARESTRESIISYASKLVEANEGKVPLLSVNKFQTFYSPLSPPLVVDKVFSFGTMIRGSGASIIKDNADAVAMLSVRGIPTD